MYEKLKELSFKEIIGYAIYSEDEANKFYTNLAKGVGELVAHRFQGFARDEEMHKRMLLSLHRDQFGDENYIVPKGLPPFEGHDLCCDVPTLIGALEKAMLNEHNAFKVYKFLAKEKKEHKKLFDYLGMMERSHYETLKAEKELYEERALDDTKGLHALSHYEWTRLI